MRAGGHGVDVDVVTGFDAGYAMPAAVMLASLERSLAPGMRCRVWVAGLDVDAELRRRIVAGRSTVEVIWLDVADEVFDGLPGSRHGLFEHIPKATYIPILLDRILPSELRRVVYLDVDTLVRRSVHGLAAADLHGHAIGAVRDFGYPSLASGGGIREWRSLGFDGSKPYLNTGVMAVDLERWRREAIGDRAVAYARSHDRLDLLDQEALNVVVRGGFTTLPMAWNAQVWVQDSAAHSALVYTVVPTPEVDAALTDPAIVHFCGPRKPWRPDEGAAPFEHEWHECRAATAWAHAEMPKPVRRRGMRVIGRLRAAARALRG